MSETRWNPEAAEPEGDLETRVEAFAADYQRWADTYDENPGLQPEARQVFRNVADGLRDICGPKTEPSPKETPMTKEARIPEEAVEAGKNKFPWYFDDVDMESAVRAILTAAYPSVEAQVIGEAKARIEGKRLHPADPVARAHYPSAFNQGVDASLSALVDTKEPDDE